MRTTALRAPLGASARAHGARRVWRAVRTRLAAQDGFSVMELIIVSALGILLMLTVLTFLEQGARSQVRTASRVDTLTQQRVGFAFMAGELRQAQTLFMVPSHATTSAVVEVDTYVRANAAYSRLRRVRYDCSASSVCTRAEGPPNSPMPVGTAAVPVIDKVISASFTPQSAPGQPAWNASQGYPGHVKVRVEVDGRPPGGVVVPIPLEDGVALRNVEPPST